MKEVTETTSPTISPSIDPARVLESVVSELEVLSADSPLGSRGDLIELHGALLMFGLGGVVSLLPSVGLGLSARRMLEFRVVRAARRLADQATSTSHLDTAVAVLELAAERIEDMIHLIDPELRVAVA
jgi:hypothetical protein